MVLRHVIHCPLVGIIVVSRLRTRFCSVDTIGLPSTNTIMNLPSLVTRSKESGISKRQEFLMNPIMVIESFDVWGIDFIGSFVSSYWMKYILIAIDYISEKVEEIALPNNKGKNVTIFF